MKILESAPSRYDRGIRLLTLGKVDKAYDRMASGIKEGQRVLDIGCGTGALTLRAAAKGASVCGIDINPQMLEMAKERVNAADLSHLVEFREMGVAELESEAPENYDVVMSGLCFSELSADEVRYALKQARRVLKTGGMLLLADEATPNGIVKRILSGLLRLPLVIITYIVTQTSTRSVKNLPVQIAEAGFKIREVGLSLLDTFVEIKAVKKADG
jgi:demethylmenaquinone methyltransferase/2-methoxy-6-polyprenyl-1,4-benzoquinol methylase